MCNLKWNSRKYHIMSIVAELAACYIVLWDCCRKSTVGLYSHYAFCCLTRLSIDLTGCGFRLDAHANLVLSYALHWEIKDEFRKRQKSLQTTGVNYCFCRSIKRCDGSGWRRLLQYVQCRDRSQLVTCDVSQSNVSSGGSSFWQLKCQTWGRILWQGRQAIWQTNVFNCSPRQEEHFWRSFLTMCIKFCF